MWEGLKQIFGTSFVTIYGDVPSPLWVAEIARLTETEVRLGLAALSRAKREYPANLTEFVEACRPKKRVRYLGVPTNPAEMRKVLGPIKATEEQRQKHLASLRSKFGRVRVPGEDDE